MPDKKQVGGQVKLHTWYWLKVQNFSVGSVLDAVADGTIDELLCDAIPVTFASDGQLKIND